ncbi:twin-arginine translocase subunit TatC [Paenibacillus sp. LHD-117]|uniref:twin-arginine translocase subunit TatC n=1 Tax=Paenibacillus sp. LHD-117 TaxID=3071412 RepID=UPI0027E19418|nr:twin-arginine translocase subunit TatC [Paenibacillus sp. LHD-117]MDQ6422948.1 twin-arginine translocase subunit TatC [Paenibacillus sp. LHD-117]
MPEGKISSLIEHLEELRRSIIWILIVLIIAMTGGFFIAKPFINYLKSVPPASDITWNAFSPLDALRIYVQFSFVIGLVVALPFIMYQIWAYVKPGLHEEEQKGTLAYIPGATILFLLGLAFAYYILFPMAFYFTSGVSKGLGLTETYGIAQYFSFMFNILIPVSILFELPIVTMFLTKLRILNPQRLKKLRRYAYFLLVIIATVITPPDFISDFLVSIPLFVLYEISIIMSGWVYRKQSKILGNHFS